MGRNKIKIEKIANERNRQATFFKRKNGLFKKAMELSILCDCDVALLVFSPQDKLFKYATTDMEKIMERYRNYKEEIQQDMSNDDYYKQYAPNEEPSPVVDDDDVVDVPPLKKQKLNNSNELAVSSGSVSASSTRKKPRVSSESSFTGDEFQQREQPRREARRTTRATSAKESELLGSPEYSSDVPAQSQSQPPQPLLAPKSEPFANNGSNYGGGTSDVYERQPPFSSLGYQTHPMGGYPWHLPEFSNGNSTGNGNSNNTSNGEARGVPPITIPHAPHSLPSSSSFTALSTEHNVPLAPKPTKSLGLTISIPTTRESGLLSPGTLASPTSFCPKIPLSPNPSGPSSLYNYPGRSPRTPTTPNAPFAPDFFRLPQFDGYYRDDNQENNYPPPPPPYVGSAFSAPSAFSSTINHSNHNNPNNSNNNNDGNTNESENK